MSNEHATPATLLLFLNSHLWNHPLGLENPFSVKHTGHTWPHPSGASTAQPTVRTDNNVPPKPADPPAEGMVSWFKSAWLKKTKEFSIHFPIFPQIALADVSCESA